MIRADIITLIKDDPASHGVFAPRAEITRTVLAEVRSVGLKETYEAMSKGLSPELVFTLQLAEDYQGERRLLFHGEQYKIIRTYQPGDGIELTVERFTNDV